MPGEAGRPSDLTDELVKKIKKYILEGKNLKETANACEIDEQKLYNWKYDNYLNISDKIENWKRDRKLMLAEGVIEEMLEMPVTVLKYDKGDDDAEPYIATEPSLVKIKQDTAKFVAETLGKKDYAKRNELSGPDGKDLMPVTEEIKNKVNTAIDEYLKDNINRGN